MKAWYLIHTKSRQEDLASKQLIKQGYEIYLPRAEVRKRKRDRIIRAIEPMFPRYLFIQLSDKKDDWGPIRSTIGVSNLVRFGQSPTPVPEALITALRSREDKNKGYHVIVGREFSPGDKIRIAEGPFEGYEAIFQEQKANDRAILLLKITQDFIKVNLHKLNIEEL
jgi:transcriptional antiterminator RfaH